MPLRPVLLLAVTALCAAALPATASPTAPTTMAAVTQVTATSSGTVDLVLPADAQVATTGDAGVRFEGQGRLLALWLERRGADGRYGFLTSYRLPQFAGGGQRSYGSTPAPACTATPSEHLPLMHDCAYDGVPQTALLPKGRYRLTVLTDGHPVGITLRLQGLTGSVSTAITTPLASAQEDLPVREAVGDSLVTFGSSVDLGAPVQTFVVAAAQRAGAVQQASVCQRGDDGSEPMAFAPHCPGGTSGSMSYQVADFQGGSAFASSSSWDEPGLVGLGGSFAASEGVDFGQALGVWLEHQGASG